MAHKHTQTQIDDPHVCWDEGSGRPAEEDRPSRPTRINLRFPFRCRVQAPIFKFHYPEKATFVCERFVGLREIKRRQCIGVIFQYFSEK